MYILARGAKEANGEEVANAAQVWTIPMIAQGYKSRIKVKSRTSHGDTEITEIH